LNLWLDVAKPQNSWATYTSRPCSATLAAETFLDIKLAATGIFVHRSWTRGCVLG